MEKKMLIGGIHHVTAIAGRPARNVAFYRKVLGLRLVKKTVNFDDPGTWHLYFGDGDGSPGSILTFFPHPLAVAGRHGVGQAVEIAFAVPKASLAWWLDRLAEKGVSYQGPLARFDEPVVRFEDHDGLALELVGDDRAAALPGWASDGVTGEHAIRGIHGVTLWEEDPSATEGVLTGALGYRKIGEEGGVVRYIAEEVMLGRVIDVRRAEGERRGLMGAGTVHHVAFRARDDAAQSDAATALGRDRIAVTPQADRNYFRSVYFREPGGVLFEIATDGPGFAVDEPVEALGASLKLPAWLEPRRAEIEGALPPLEEAELAQRSG